METEQKDDSNGLENFGIDEIEESTPDLFNSDENLDEKFTSFEDTEKTKDEEDDLELEAIIKELEDEIEEDEHEELDPKELPIIKVAEFSKATRFR